MTVSTTSNRINQAGDGVSTVFAFPYKFIQAADIKVYVNNALLSSGYTVGTPTDTGANVTFSAAPANGATIVFVSDPARTQGTSLPATGPFPAKTVETALDKLTLLVQRLADLVSRSFTLSDGDTSAPTTSLPLVSSLKGAVLAFNATTGAPEAGPTIAAVGTVAANSASINTVAANITAVQGAAGNASAASASATAAAASQTAAAASASAASGSASSASSSATSASASAATASAAAASGLYRQVLDKSANYTIVAADNGTLFRASTGSGAVTFTLPSISAVTDGYKVSVVKWTSDGNIVNVNRAGSDTINGGTAVQIQSQYSQIVFVADFETNQWFASQSGLGATNNNVDVFSGNGSTTGFTLSADPGSKNNTRIHIGGVYQFKSTYSVSGTTLTFSSAPPSGTSNIEVEYGTPLAIGTPSDGTVSTAKIQDGALSADTTGLAKMADGFLQATTAGLAKMADGFLAATTAGRAKMADLFVTTAKIADANVTPAKLSQPLTLGTAQNSTSGTAIDFTAIPSWVKRITIMFNGVSGSGSSSNIIQLGSGSFETTGYKGAVAYFSTSSMATYQAGGTGILINQSLGGAQLLDGHVVLTNISGNNWIASFNLANESGTNAWSGAGAKTLSGTLDRVRITTINGTDTFDAGSINILYE